VVVVDDVVAGAWRLGLGRGRRLGESGACQRKGRGGGEHGDLGFHQLRSVVKGPRLAKTNAT
jgi:hypothetical protein